ncbi:MAG: DNA polymerase I [Candidatus Aminicenantes bacterium]|nr:DNA polymerase I [Candidatus Aminicenantes bacterium]
MSEKKLYLIDGNSLLYRSYYAIQRLSTSQGFPTNAIYGFITTLRKLMDREKPEYLGIVFDAPGPKLRHDIYKDYKAQRKPMPEDLVKQVPKLKEVIAALRVPVIVHERYEADDVLGSLARRAAAKDFVTVIVTTDKDLLQLVDGSTLVYNPAKEITLDAAKVKEVFGAAPAQVIDVLSLWGDPSDNIPGVPGIGEKTAKSLIEEFGSLDNLLKNLERIKNPRVKEKLEQNLDKLEMSRQLVTIEQAMDLEFDPKRFKVSEPDAAEATRLFRELEFTSLLAEYAKKPNKTERVYSAIFAERELKELAAKIKKAGLVSLDTETDNIFPTRARLVGMSFSIEPGTAFYLPLRHDYLGAPKQISVDAAFGILRGLLEDPKVRKIGQNIKYDLIVLEREGLNLKGIDLDTMVLSYLLEPNWGKHNLDRQATVYLQAPAIPFHKVVGKGKSKVTMNRAAVETVTPYACQDADYALEISRLLWPKIEAAKLDRLYRDLEQPLIEILADMETIGVKVDADALQRLSKELASELARLEKKIYEASGTEFNIHSPQQLAQVLFHKLQLNMRKKTKATKSFSTSMDVLEELAQVHPLPGFVLEYRQFSKLKSTYADALTELIDPVTGRIHTSYNQTVASTGRLSSSDPNLQNIPARGDWGKRFRRAFVPEKGRLFLGADYSQIELRVLAHMSEDPGLIETFRNDHDVHEETAQRVFGPASGLLKDDQRRKAKIINFSILYGTSAFSLAKEIQTSNAEAQQFIDRYYEKYPKVKEFLDKMVEQAKAKGYSETMFGRRRQVPELRQSDKVGQQAGRRIALNMPIQGTAADIMKKAMIDVWREIRRQGLGARMILQVHDELVFEVPEKEKARVERLVRDKMENVFSFKVPLKVSLGWGPTWADAK